jgi:16S rRNA (adenine1518-N6/adenine1519-N6)-dimethyltransferase
LNSDNIEVIKADFLEFDLSGLPAGYKVVANIPYYITGKIVEKLLTAQPQPSLVALLVQWEVAERLAARPGGDMSVLTVMTQLHSQVSLGLVVPAQLFMPPPKIDSQVVILRPHPLPEGLDEKLFARVVKAGFSARRKKLRTAISGGLNIAVPQAEKILRGAGVNPDLRAQNLSLADWQAIMLQLKHDQYH